MTYSEMNVSEQYLFNEGNHFHSYRYMGVHLTERDGEKGAIFRVWAPKAKKIAVVGDFNQWDGNVHVMRKYEDSGIWELFISGINQWDLYKFEVTGANNITKRKSDPYGFYGELRPGTGSKVFDYGNYSWNDLDWYEKKRNQCIYEKPLNIYEVHFGSWKRKWDGAFFTYREIADELIPYVVEMGYTHIEILPLAEHPLDDSWGYQATGYFSITSRYGSPYDLMYFIDQCHASDIGVIVDWAPSHFCRDDHGLRMFDGTPLFEHHHPLRADNEGWGTTNFNFGKAEVGSFLISNAVYWFDVYHVDGIRIDAVANMLYYDFEKRQGRWLPNKYGGRENLEAVEFIKKLNQTIFRYYEQPLMMAEESTTWPGVTKPVHEGGLGFNYKWNMGWMNDTLKYMKRDSGDRKHHHNQITFSLMYAFTENFVLPLSHDEVVHGKKALVDKMPGDYWQQFANLRLLLGYMFSHPGKKLTFMGTELGQYMEWRFRYGLDWGLLEYESHRKHQEFMKALNHIYLSEKSLWEKDHGWDGFRWIDADNGEQSLVAYYRRSSDWRDFIVVVANFTPVTYEEYRIGVPRRGMYREILNSDDLNYFGSGVVNSEPREAEPTPWQGQPYSIQLRVPPLGFIYFKPYAVKPNRNWVRASTNRGIEQFDTLKSGRYKVEVEAQETRKEDIRRQEA